MRTTDTKETPVFQASSIRAMSPMGREIAAMLKDAGYIKIIEQPAQERS